ncbi:MAG TPA: hypothetical protein VGS27_03460 [Candidatus Sulfotelmatobacter sp.]|nr:hypothetical protein [Candidatus Sulfotelmatobacter sp.]
MRLSWRRSSRAEDRFEAWVTESHQKWVLAGGTTSVGSCPDEAFLRDLARKARRIKLSDPRIDHAATCPTCLNQLLEFRQEIRSRWRKLAVAGFVTACLVIAAVIAVARYGVQRQSPASNMAIVSETVNLWDVGTFRGEQPGQLQFVPLPAARLRLKIILPRFSPPGQYLVAVTRDQSGNGVMAEGSAVALANGDKETVAVDLDLRKAKSGQYFLSTTHEQDQASYYYPLQIQ